MAILKDSGERRSFDSGAVRDVQEGKGRMDLIPLKSVAMCVSEPKIAAILVDINSFIESADCNHIINAIKTFCNYNNWYEGSMILEVAKQYEDGAKKYTERNWQLGINEHCFIDSGVRHLMKVYRGDTDEPHDRAFIWNMLGLLWTHEHRPDLIEYPIEKKFL